MKFVREIGEYKDGKSYYHVALTGTQNYIPWIGVTMTSIMEHNSACFGFHILVDKTDENDIDRLERFSRQWNVPVTLYYMNDDELARYAKFDRYFIGGRYIATLVYRFVVPDVVSSQVKRILYLDGDVVCNGSIIDYFNSEMGNKIVAVSEDLKGSEYAQRMHVSKYFNAGIILIDVNKWKRHQLTGQFLSEMEKECSIHPTLSCADQDILNKFLAEKALFVPHIYNLPYRLVQPSIFKSKIINEDAMQASLIHFIGAIKPWTTYNQSVPIVKVWAHAKENSPWRDVPLHVPNSQKALHQAARDARRRHAYKEMVGWYCRFIKSKFDGTKKVGY